MMALNIKLLRSLEGWRRNYSVPSATPFTPHIQQWVLLWPNINLGGVRRNIESEKFYFILCVRSQLE